MDPGILKRGDDDFIPQKVMVEKVFAYEFK